MNTFRWAALALATLAAGAWGQAPSRDSYSLSLELAETDGKAVASVYRDGARQRIEGIERQRITLFDFAAHVVYWLGPGQECTMGRYDGRRAPAVFDPITGTPDNLVLLTYGRRRHPAGTGQVNGIPARMEEFERASPPPGGWLPTRVWLAEDGGFLLKMEGYDTDGRLTTLFEVKHIAWEKPSPDLFSPPAGCRDSRNEMLETGEIRARAAE